MRLLRIKLDGFGQFNHGLSVKLEPARLNLIVGRNEAGESTLLNATAGILFGFRDLNVMRRYEPWGEHDSYSGELEFLADDGRRIRVSRDFRTGRAAIVSIEPTEDRVLFSGSADPRGTTAEDRRYFDLLGEMLGIEDESIFCNTVFVGQMSLKTAVSDQIRRLLSGSSAVDYKGALHDLHGRFSDLTNENPWKSRGLGKKRALDQSRDELQATEKSLEDGRSRLLRFIEVEGEILDLDRRKSEHGATMRALESNIAAAERLASLLGRREEAGRRADELRKRHETLTVHQQKMQAADERIRREFVQFRNASESFQDDANAWMAESAERERESVALASEKERLAGLEPTPNRGLGGALAAILLAGSAAAGMWSPFGVVPGLVVGAVLACAGFMIGSNLGTGFRARKEELERRVKDLEAAIRGRNRRLDELSAATSNLLLGADAEAVLASYREFAALREDRKRHLAATRAIGDADALSASLAEAVRDQGRIEAALEEAASGTTWLAGFGDPVKLGVEISRLREELRSREAMRETERERAERLRVEIAGLSARMDFDLPGLVDAAREKRLQVRDLALERTPSRRRSTRWTRASRTSRRATCSASRRRCRSSSRASPTRSTRACTSAPRSSRWSPPGTGSESGRKICPPARTTSSTSPCGSRW
jgi:DNA repair exonuclease SbcCD ATPase subunit